MLDRAIRRAQDQETKKASEDIEYNLYLQNFNELLQLIQVGGETLKMVSIIFTCFADSKNDLDQVVSNLKNEIIRNRFTVNDMWLSNFNEIENVNISIRVRHLDNITAFKLLDRFQVNR